MGIGDIAAVRVKHSGACCELVGTCPCDPFGSLGCPWQGVPNRAKHNLALLPFPLLYHSPDCPAQ
eukprot:10687445-Heterocapsa_arctica.AAC.1